jgi:hypothetical protein
MVAIMTVPWPISTEYSEDSRYNTLLQVRRHIVAAVLLTCVLLREPLAGSSASASSNSALQLADVLHVWMLKPQERCESY